MERSELAHLALFDAAFLLAASKNAEYRARTMMRARATAEVFDEQGICSVPLRERYERSPETFRVTLGELTDTGLQFARVDYQKWLAKSDRWQGDAAFEKLKQSLEQQWHKSRTRSRTPEI